MSACVCACLPSLVFFFLFCPPSLRVTFPWALSPCPPVRDHTHLRSPCARSAFENSAYLRTAVPLHLPNKKKSLIVPCLWSICVNESHQERTKRAGILRGGSRVPRGRRGRHKSSIDHVHLVEINMRVSSQLVGSSSPQSLESQMNTLVVPSIFWRGNNKGLIYQIRSSLFWREERWYLCRAA